MVQPTENGELSTDVRKLPEFAFAKHMPDVMNRILTEIAGAPFLKQASGAGKSKRAAPATAAGSSEATTGAVDINDLLQPKKKAKRAAGAKRKAGKSGAQQEDASNVAIDDLQQDVAMQGENGDEGIATRPRWWVDDVLGCLAHAAGGAQSAQQ